jgi:ribose-phosphate pyrophosphokinase
MQKINLISLEKSQVKYESTVFPDGEPHIKLAPVDRKEDYLVICRITNPSELFILMQVANILNRQGVEWDLEIRYLMSQRMDRVITFEEAFSLELVANVINSFNARRVVIFEPHSDRAIKLINRSVADPKSDLFNELFHGKIICYPDDGAARRYMRSDVKPNGYLIMEKKRDLENKGKIISLEVKELDQTAYESARPIIITDDLCDGGGTFVWAAEILRKEFPNRTLEILVRHMVNPAGLEKLSKTFSHVYITDSYKSWENLPENVRMIEL